MNTTNALQKNNDYNIQLPGFSIRAGVIIFLISFAHFISNPLLAQTPPPTFIEITGDGNPLNGCDMGSRSNLDLVDIDSDGDMDVFIGDASGEIGHYLNTGNAVVPVFTLQTGFTNPFDGINIGDRSYPAFIDIDNDGDCDAFIGQKNGSIHYFKNTGTPTSPLFVEYIGASNPFDGMSVGADSAPTFVDIDSDGDFDAFVGAASGLLHYFENIGTGLSPVFMEMTGAANPFSGIDLGSNTTPAFSDIDFDGDQDAFSGEINGNINYFLNVGDATTPSFVMQHGAYNPLDAMNVGSRSTPTFVDLDSDGDWEAFSGEVNGTIKYFQNTTFVLPVELTDFRAIHHQQEVILKWKTVTEINNDGFDIEHSYDGASWETLGFVRGNGTTSEENTYQYLHEAPLSGINYYRLKQIDFDGKFDYSKVISIQIQKIAATFQIYPNPATSGMVTIELDNAADQDIHIILYDYSGRIVKNQILQQSDTQLDVSQLNQGMYILKTVINKNIVQEKLVIE